MNPVYGLHAHVYNMAGAEQGELDEIWNWEYQEQIDGAGKWQLECYATAANTALLVEGYRVDVYATVEGSERLLSSGYITTVEPQVKGPSSSYQVVGDDRIIELGWRVILALDICEQAWQSLDGGLGAVREIRRTGSTVSDTDKPELYDNDTDTWVGIRIGTIDEGGNEYRFLYVGCDQRFDRVRFDLRTPCSNSTPTTLAAQYYAGEAGWVSLTISDGTAVGGVTWKQDGDVTFTRPTDWERCTPTATAGSWFWVRFYTTDRNTEGATEAREIYVYGDAPTGGALDMIMAYAPDSWVKTGYADTEDAFMQIAGLSVLQALEQLRKQLGNHYRATWNGSAMELEWLTSFASSGLTASGSALPDTTHVALEELLPQRDIAELVTRVYPYGADGLTLEKTTRSASTPYELSAGGNYIRNTTAETAYGRRERVARFSDITVQQADSYTQQVQYAADALFDRALAWLQQHDSLAEGYTFNAIGFRQILRPGQTIVVDAEATVQGTKVIDVNDTLNVLSVRSYLTDEDCLAAELEVSTLERQAIDDAEIVAEALQQMASLQSGRATVTNVVTQSIISGDVNIDGGTIDGVAIGSELPAAGTFTDLEFGSIGDHDHSGTGSGGQIDHADLDNVSADQHHAGFVGLVSDAVTASPNASDLVELIEGTGVTIGVAGSQVTIGVDTAASWAWTGNHTFHHIAPAAPDAYECGSTLYPWLALHASEIRATIFAKETASLVGGWLIVPHNSGILAADVDSADTQIDFGQAMDAGDFIVLRDVGKVEYLQVGSLVSGTVYNVTRNLDGSGANDWPAGAVYLVAGADGDGRIELRAYDSPQISIVEQGATYSAISEMVRIGELNGGWGYSAHATGMALGQYVTDGANLTWDVTNGLRLRVYDETIIQLDNDGNAYIQGLLQMGASGEINIGSGAVVIDNGSINIGYDQEGLRLLANEEGSIYDAIYHNATSDALHIESATQYWQIMESGGAKMAMDGDFVKLQSGGSNDEMSLGMGDDSNNWALLTADNTPSLRVYIGTGGSPTLQGQIVKQYNAATQTPRVVMVSLEISSGSYKRIAAGVRNYVMMASVYNASTNAWIAHLFTGCAQPGSGSTDRYFTSDRDSVYGTSGDVYADLWTGGDLNIHNNAAVTVRIVGWAVFTA